MGLRTRMEDGIRVHSLAIVFFLILAVLLTWPVAITAGSALENEGDAVLNAWTLGWDVKHLLSPRALPHAPNFYPYPYTLYFSENLLGAALLAAPVITATGNPILAYNILFIGAFALAAAATYLLVWSLTQDPEAAVLAGVLFAGMTLRFGPSPQLQVLLNFGIPLSLFFLFRLFRNGRVREGIGLGLSVALQTLISIYHGLFLLLGLLVLSTERLVHSRIPRRVAGSGLLLAIVLAGGILIPILWPYVEAHRYVGGRSLGDQAAFGLLSFLLVPHGHLYARMPVFGEIHRYAHVETLFPGWVALGLAAAGLLRRRSSGRRPFALLTLLGFTFSIGPALRLRLEDPPILIGMPYLFLWTAFPAFQAIRVPARMFVLAQLGLAVLAGLGWRVWRPSLPRPRGVFGALLLLAVLEAYRGPFPRFPIPTSASALDTWLAQQTRETPFVEFPTLRTLDLTADPISLSRLAHQQFSTLYRRQPTPIGYSGFFPPLFWEVADRLLMFPSREGIAFLSDLGVRAVLVRSEGWLPGEREAFEARWTLFSHVFELAQESPAGRLYLLKPPPPGDGRLPQLIGKTEGERLWLFLHWPRGSGSGRIALTPPRYILRWRGEGRNGFLERTVQGTLPRALPAYVTLLPLTAIPMPSGISRWEAILHLEPGEIGRRSLPPLPPLELRRISEPEEIAAALPVASGFEELGLEFDNGGLLIALVRSGHAFCPGEVLEFTLFWTVTDAARWRAQEATPVVFVHLHDAHGRMAAGRDLPVDFGSRPFREWKEGEIVMQSYRLPLPTDLSPGPADLVLGLYPIGRPDAASRWAIRSGHIPLREPGAAQVARVEILPTPCRVPEEPFP
jgi:hypothetical protein